MYSNFFFLLKNKKVRWLLLLTIFHCSSAFAIPLDSTCFKGNVDSISMYFSGKSNPYQVEAFFECTDNVIQLFLNHTTTTNGSYNKIELKRLMQYMGYDEVEAKKIAKALLLIKAGFIGGSVKLLTLKEIDTIRKVLFIISKKMRALHSSIPTVLNILDRDSNNSERSKLTSRKELISASSKIVKVLRELGQRLARLPVNPNLYLLNQLPKYFQTLGMSNKNLQYWNPTFSFLIQWKNIFFSSSKNIIKSREWEPLMESLGHFTHIWLYQKRFLKDRNWLHTDIIPHTQHFLSYSLYLIENIYKKSHSKGILLTSIDSLAKSTWFLPSFLSEPIFRLGLRSAYCFLLVPQAKDKTCTHTLDFQASTVSVAFSDVSFIIEPGKKLKEKKLSVPSDTISIVHLTILRERLNAWILDEFTTRKKEKFPSLFGNPIQWLDRKIDISLDSRFVFYKERTDDQGLISHLTWQSHLMKLMSSSYINRENKKMDQTLWNTLIREWAPFSVALYEDIKWSSFQDLGSKIFKQADLLTSRSNGDNILQEEEILDLFSLFSSALNTAIITAKIMKETCTNPNFEDLIAICAWDYFLELTPSIFAGFPYLLKELESKEKKDRYMEILYPMVTDEGLLSFRNLFEIFIFIHYQENVMQSLDTNFSQSLQAEEFVPLMRPFAQNIITSVPFIYSKAEAFSFITYFFHYGDIPVFNSNGSISAPLRFSNWLLKAGQWEMEVDRADILRALLLTKEF